MSASRGRPKSVNPKSDRLYIRVTSDEKESIMNTARNHKVSVLDMLNIGSESLNNREVPINNTRIVHSFGVAPLSSFSNIETIPDASNNIYIPLDKKTKNKIKRICKYNNCNINDFLLNCIDEEYQRITDKK